jgi:hypothetical protein
MFVKLFDFSTEGKLFKIKQNIKCSFTVKLSKSLFVGKLGLTLNTCDGKTSGTVPDDAVAIDLNE